jgi:8-oxo-dGTP pyrophosphatase MutT (NUDIX family)
MPWTAEQFKSRHNHSLSGPQAEHASHIANAILRSGANEGTAIATANKMAERAPGGSLMPQGGILGGGLNAISTPTLQNAAAARPGTSNTAGLAAVNANLAQRQPSSLASSSLTPSPGYDIGGTVDPNQGNIGGIQPTSGTSSPLMKGLIQRYAGLPTEKLTELSQAMGKSPQGQIIQALLTQRRTQPNAGGQQPIESYPPQTPAAVSPSMMMNNPVPVAAVARGGAIKKVAAAGLVIRIPSGELLFLKRGKGGDYPGTWCFPGGHIEKGENAEQAARREFKEETGHEFSGKLIQVDKGANGFITFGADVPKKFDPKIDAEHTEYKWATPKDAPQPLHPGVRASLIKYIRATTPKRDMGGSMSLSTLDPSWTRQDWQQAGRTQTGFLGGNTLGRADSIKTQAPAGSYILPADVIAGLGEGNSNAGSRVFDEILHTLPYGIQGSRQPGGRGPPTAQRMSFPRNESKGGAVKSDTVEPVDVLLSDGERVVMPSHVKAIGRGDLRRGHAILDNFVLSERKKNIKKLKSLPPPVKPRGKAA